MGVWKLEDNFMIVIYKATFENGKFYIGLTNNLGKRKDCHRRKSENGSTTHFHNAIRKYGFYTIVWEILSRHATREDAEIAEIETIGLLAPDYNITKGGRSPTMTQQTKDKMSKSASGKIKSESAKDNMKKAQRLKSKTKENTYSLSEEFLNKFNSGNLNKSVLRRLYKLRDIYSEEMSLDTISGLSGISKSTIMRYQRYWNKLDEYIPQTSTGRAGYKLKKSKDKDMRWKQKRIQKTRKRNEIYKLLKLDTKDLTLADIGRATNISIPRVQNLARCWEDMLEEEGF